MLEEIQRRLKRVSEAQRQAHINIVTGENIVKEMDKFITNNYKERV